MGIRTVKPTSPSRRYLTYVTYEEITQTEPEKRLLIPTRRTNGRNAYGRITVRHRGGGAKRMLRQVDFRRDKIGIPARVAAIEYDPNRSAHLALLHYRDGEKRYIIATHGLKVGDTLMSGDRKSTRLNSSHMSISYAVFCLKKKKKKEKENTA